MDSEDSPDITVNDTELLTRVIEEGGTTDVRRQSQRQRRVRHDQDRNASNGQTTGVVTTDAREDRRTDSARRQEDAPIGRFDQRESPTGDGSIDTNQGLDTATPRQQSQIRIVPAAPASPQEKADRQRELAKERKRRYRAREKAKLTGSVENFTPFTQAHSGVASRSDETQSEPTSQPRFTLRAPFRDRGKGTRTRRVYSQKEVDEKLPRLTEVYQRGSSLIDDMLEIVVRGHEPVSIWRLDDDEAETMALIHLTRAMHDAAAAQSADRLIEVYEHAYILLMITPRLRMTVVYAKEKGGFSFK
jgi:hypothetical protein